MSKIELPWSFLSNINPSPSPPGPANKSIIGILSVLFKKNQLLSQN